jgi:hypothetical protein
MKAEDFSVNATDIAKPNVISYLNVLSVDDSAKTMRAKF